MVITPTLLIAFGFLYAYYQEPKIFKGLGIELPKSPKEPSIMCNICKKDLSNEYPYTCIECGETVCYKHAKTYEGNGYCISCLRKMGLLT
jgi:hypothetical protein